LKLFKNISPLFICLLFFISILSCRQNNKNKVTEQKQKKDSTGVIYEYDTTKVVLHKSGFYISKNGDVYQRNGITHDDSTGFWSTHHWLDSTMFFGEYPNKKALKLIIDLETFSRDSTSSYEKDKNHVYYTRASSDGVRRCIVDGADSKTFISLADRYGKDKSHIFYMMEIIKGADLKTFHVVNRDTARDKKHLYVDGDIIEE
jgi:DKNYY family